MEIRSSLEGLNSLLGVNAPGAAQSQGTGRATAGAWGLGADQATLSSAASQMAQATSGDGVRMDKVAAVQAALSDGTYSVPASAVASKLVDAMLAGG